MLTFDCWASYIRDHKSVREKVAQETMYSPEPPLTLTIYVRSGSGLSRAAIGEQLDEFRVDFPAVVREDTGRPVMSDPWTAARVMVKDNKDMLNGTHAIELLEVTS